MAGDIDTLFVDIQSRLTRFKREFASEFSVRVAQRTPVDNQGNTYTTDKFATGVGGVGDVLLTSAPNVASSGTFTISITPTATSYLALGGIAFSGASTFEPLDVVSQQKTTSTTSVSSISTPVSAATTQADEVAIAIFSLGNTSTLTSISTATGYTTPISSVNGAASAVGAMAFKVLTATGTQQATFNFGSASGTGTAGYNTIIATYKGVVNDTVYLRRSTMRQQPQQPTPIDWSNPITRKLIACWNFGRGHNGDMLAPNYQMTPVGTPGLDANLAGRGLSLDGSSYIKTTKGYLPDNSKVFSMTIAEVEGQVSAIARARNVTFSQAEIEAMTLQTIARARTLAATISESESVSATLQRIRTATLAIAEVEGASVALDRLRGLVQQIANITQYSFTLTFNSAVPALLNVLIEWDEWQTVTTVGGFTQQLSHKQESISFAPHTFSTTSVITTGASTLVIPDNTL